MIEKVRVADIALDVKSVGRESVFTYLVDAAARPGDGFFVTVGNRPAIGYAIRVYEATEDELGFPLSALKSPTGRIEGLSLPEPLVDLVHFVASEYLCTMPSALSPAMPPGVLDRVGSVWSINQSVIENNPHQLTTLQQEIVRTISDAGGKLETPKKGFADATAKAMKLLRGKNILTEQLVLNPQSEEKRAAQLYQLSQEPDYLEKFLSANAKKKPAQALVVMRLQEIEQHALRLSDIKALCGVADTTIKQLIESKVLQPVESDQHSLRSIPQPNSHQKIAVDALIESIQSQSNDAYLLFGITGSGKTEVFLRAAAEAVRQGKQVLYLVPEIALATQAVAHLRERFGPSVAVLHSELTPKERLDNWIAVREGRSAIVLGARSAIFAPLSNLGLIVIDEEHEASYKQESSPRYHIKTLARRLAKTHRCPVVFGSATPSVESFLEADQGEMKLLSLPKRAANAVLPEVMIHNLADDFQAGQPSILSGVLKEKMQTALERGQQVILFLNRRAYSAFLLCRDCGHQLNCPNCSVTFAYSRKSGRIRCHQCGHSELAPSVCPECQGTRLKPLGVGTEKVEESVQQEFPDYRVARLDRDISARKGALEKTLAEFGAGETHILVGTQMVAKGLNFPNVTLVGVIAADISLSIPDFRASERTFQLLSQVAGRAGRGKLAGEVVIQTFNPEHPAILKAKEHDYVGYFEDLLEERRSADYPPFCRIINIICAGENLSNVRAEVDHLASQVREIAPESRVLGPVECAIERIQNRWRHHILVKIPNGFDLPKLNALTRHKPRAGVQVILDVDPYSLM